MYSGRVFLPLLVTRALPSRQPEGELSPREHEMLQLLVAGRSTERSRRRWASRKRR